jgi:hypothetical protein
VTQEDAEHDTGQTTAEQAKQTTDDFAPPVTGDIE